MKPSSFCTGILQLLDDHGSLVHEPDFPCLLAGLFPGEEGDGSIHGVLLLAEVEDIAVGLGAVEHAVGAGEGLDQAVVLELLVHVDCVQVFRIKAGEQHVHHDGDVDLLRGGVVGVRPLLILDALLHILIVEIEFGDAVVRAVAGIVIGEDGFERRFLAHGIRFVVLLFLGQVFLDLLHIGIALGGRGENAGDVQRLEVGVGSLFLFLHRFEQPVVFDGVIDGGGGEDGIETASSCGGIVPAEDGLDDGAFREAFAGLGQGFAVLFLGLEVVDVEAEDVPVLDGVGDGIGVELLLEEVFRGLHGGLRVLDLLLGGVFLEYGRAGETEELCLGEKLLDRLVVLAELGAVALIEDEGDAFSR